MALDDKQKMERAEYLGNNLKVTECSRGEHYVFISYASDDWETVFKKAVVPLQEQYGLRVFADKAFDKVNDKWIVPMLRNVRGSDLMIAFVSQKYIESYACFLEILTAVNSRKQIIFVALENDLRIGASDEQPAIERGAKIELLNQGANITTITNNTSNDILRAMKSAFTSISTFIEQDSLSKDDISDAFINFFRDAAINKKTINDLIALQSTIRSVSKNVFAFDAQPADIPAAPQDTYFTLPDAPSPTAPAPTAPAPTAPAPTAPQETSVPLTDAPAPNEQPAEYTQANRSYNDGGIQPAAVYPAAVQNNEKLKRIAIISVLSFLVVLLAILLIVSLSKKPADDIPASAEVSETTAAEITEAATEEAKPENGSYTDEEGNYYEGDLLNGIPNGQGTMTYTNGDVYTGEWKDGLKSGQGTITYASGTVYEGEWKDDKRNGQGTYTWASGNIYVGEFKDNVRNGHGTVTWTDGTVYEGEWKDDKANGQGTMTYAEGDVYEGEWKDDNKNGQGIYTFANGDIYEGEWKDDSKNGHGTYIFANGEVWSGQWENGEFIG